MIRFIKNKMNEILPYLGLETICYYYRFIASSEVAFAVLYMQLSYPKKLKTMLHHFSYSRSWLSVVFNDVIMHLVRDYKKKTKLE